MQENLKVGASSEGNPTFSWEDNDNEPLKMHWYTKYIYIYTAPKIRNKYSEERYWMASFPISAFMYHVWAIYIFPRSVHLFFAILGIYKSLTDRLMEKFGNEAAQF